VGQAWLVELITTSTQEKAMNPQPLFCPYSECPSRGREIVGNLRVHQSLRQRFFCKRCGSTFSLRRGTPLLGPKTPEEKVLLVLSLLAYGCPPKAIVAAFGLDERTLKRWQKRAGNHCQTVQTHLLEGAPLDLGQEVSTAYIERLNATFRQRLACLCRRSRALARLPETLTQGMYLVGSVYNFCTPHQTLSKQYKTPTTLAMAAGLTQEIWSVSTLLLFRIPPVFVPRKSAKPGRKKRLVEEEGRRRLAAL
jgi:transposase-like protein